MKGGLADRGRGVGVSSASFLISLAALFSFVAVATGAEWKGTESSEEGLLVVRNPEAPVESPVDFRLKELWRVGGDEDEEMLLGVVSRLVEDVDGNTYLLDSQLNEVLVLSPEGELLRTLGRQGEGPGEFNNPFDIFIGPNDLVHVAQVFPGRIVRLTRTGDPAGQFRLPETEGGAFQLVYRCQANSDHLVISGALQEGGGQERRQRTYLKAFDVDGNETAHYTDEANPMRFGGMKFEEKTFSNFSSRWGLAPDGRVAAALDFDAYRLRVWNADGSVDRVIERPGYESLARTSAQRSRFQAMYDGIISWNPGSTFEISPTHVTINQVTFRDDGTLWVLSGRGVWERDPGVLAAFDVFDAAGRFVRHVRLLGEGDPADDGVFLAGNRVYVVTELFSARMGSMGAASEDEEMEEPEAVSVIAYEMVAN